MSEQLRREIEDIGKAAANLAKVTGDHDTTIRAMHVPETLNLIAKLCDALERLVEESDRKG